jgi:hypothetical protein
MLNLEISVSLLQAAQRSTLALMVDSISNSDTPEVHHTPRVNALIISNQPREQEKVM